MQLKMLVAMSGPELSIAVDDVRDFDDAAAERLIAAGYAAPADDTPPPVRAPVKPARARR